MSGIVRSIIFTAMRGNDDRFKRSEELFPRCDFEVNELNGGAVTWLRWHAAFKSILVAQ